jgi:hypothetical protein
VPEIAEREGKDASVMLLYISLVLLDRCPVGRCWSGWVRAAGLGRRGGGPHFGVAVISLRRCRGLDRGSPRAFGAAFEHAWS